MLIVDDDVLAALRVFHTHTHQHHTTLCIIYIVLPGIYMAQKHPDGNYFLNGNYTRLLRRIGAVEGESGLLASASCTGYCHSDSAGYTL